MKPIVASLLLASSLVCPAQEGPLHLIKIEKIEATVQETPVYAAKGPRDKDAESRQWIEIEAEMVLVTKDPSGFLPQLDAKWFAILIDGTTKKPVQLTGTCSFKDVRPEASTRDKKVHLSAYISPDTLQKVTQEKTLRPNDIQSVALVVSGPNIANDAKYAAGLQKASSKEESEWWTKSLYPTIDGAILPKSKTPFALLWTDRYPGEK
ncbi:MAG TPA: Amuc_1102 family pilus-like protein, partial [Luteolibacter sp.]|nr:Amuc_1102 family pilus-like protein [Luteolibacter sp.]